MNCLKIGYTKINNFERNILTLIDFYKLLIYKFIEKGEKNDYRTN
jgi:hypothetical protein